MRTYQDYSPSELEWLDAVPGHWELHRNKYLFREVNERTETGNETLCSLTKERGLIDRSEVTDREAMASTLEGYKVCRPGDLVMNRMQAWNGMFGFAEEVGLVSPDYSVYRPSDHINSRYYEYLFSSPLYIDAFQRRSKGVGSGFLRLYTPDFHDIRALVPPRSEQDAIANYLDEKTPDINAYIAKKRDLVDLLKTQRRAVVNRAVTKGLDDDVEMRDSGVEWLGEIPAHWEQVRLKYLAESIIDAEHKTAPAHSDGDYLVVRTSNIRDGKLVLDDVYYTNEDGFREWTQRGVPQPGDILFTREAPAGEACLVPDDIPLCLGQRVVCIKVDEERLRPSFAMRVLNSSLTDEFIKVTSRGATVDHFNMSDIGKIPFLVPPLDEQKRIVEHIDALTADIDAAIERTEQQIALMQQYHTSLVTEVVTGAVDVRAEVAV